MISECGTAVKCRWHCSDIEDGGDVQLQHCNADASGMLSCWLNYVSSDSYELRFYDDVGNILAVYSVTIEDRNCNSNRYLGTRRMPSQFNCEYHIAAAAVLLFCEFY